MEMKKKMKIINQNQMMILIFLKLTEMIEMEMMMIMEMIEMEMMMIAT
jgi:hypothetical protein